MEKHIRKTGRGIILIFYFVSGPHRSIASMESASEQDGGRALRARRAAMASMDESATRAHSWTRARGGRAAPAPSCASMLDAASGERRAVWTLGVAPRVWGAPRPAAALRLCRVHRTAGCAAPPLCAEAIDIALRHVAEHGWRTKRHVAHNTTDFEVDDCAPLAALLRPLVARAVLPRIAALFFDSEMVPGEGAEGAAACSGREAGGVHLEVNDLFFVKYDAAHQASLGPHRDGSLVSFSIAMNAPDEFTGGGTFFEHPEIEAAAAACDGTARCAREVEERRADDLVVVRPSAVGDLISHSGKLVHGGVAITEGLRYIVVGFVSVVGGHIDSDFLSSQTVGMVRIDPSLDWSILCGAVGGTESPKAARGGIDAEHWPYTIDQSKIDALAALSRARGVRAV